MTWFSFITFPWEEDSDSDDEVLVEKDDSSETQMDKSSSTFLLDGESAELTGIKKVSIKEVQPVKQVEPVKEVQPVRKVQQASTRSQGQNRAGNNVLALYSNPAQRSHEMNSLLEANIRILHEVIGESFGFLDVFMTGFQAKVRRGDPMALMRLCGSAEKCFEFIEYSEARLYQRMVKLIEEKPRGVHTTDAFGNSVLQLALTNPFMASNLHMIKLIAAISEALTEQTKSELEMKELEEKKKHLPNFRKMESKREQKLKMALEIPPRIRNILKQPYKADLNVDIPSFGKIMRLKSFTGELPLHTACKGGLATFDVIEYLIQANPSAVCIPDSILQNLPLHNACIAATKDHSVPIETVRLLVEQWPDAVKQTNCQGNLPLHLVAQIKSVMSEDNTKMTYTMAALNAGRAEEDLSERSTFSARETSSHLMDVSLNGDEGVSSHAFNFISSSDKNQTAKEEEEKRKAIQSKAVAEARERYQRQFEIIRFLYEQYPEGLQMRNHHGVNPFQIANASSRLINIGDDDFDLDIPIVDYLADPDEWQHNELLLDAAKEKATENDSDLGASGAEWLDLKTLKNQGEAESPWEFGHASQLEDPMDELLALKQMDHETFHIDEKLGRSFDSFYVDMPAGEDESIDANKTGETRAETSILSKSEHSSRLSGSRHKPAFVAGQDDENQESSTVQVMVPNHDIEDTVEEIIAPDVLHVDRDEKAGLREAGMSLSSIRSQSLSMNHTSKHGQSSEDRRQIARNVNAVEKGLGAKDDETGNHVEKMETVNTIEDAQAIKANKEVKTSVFHRKRVEDSGTMDEQSIDFGIFHDVTSPEASPPVTPTIPKTVVTTTTNSMGPVKKNKQSVACGFGMAPPRRGSGFGTLPNRRQSRRRRQTAGSDESFSFMSRDTQDSHNNMSHDNMSVISAISGHSHKSVETIKTHPSVLSMADSRATHKTEQPQTAGQSSTEKETTRPERKASRKKSRSKTKMRNYSSGSISISGESLGGATAESERFEL